MSLSAKGENLSMENSLEVANIHGQCPALSTPVMDVAFPLIDTRVHLSDSGEKY